MSRRRHCECESYYMPYQHYPVRYMDLTQAMGGGTPQVPGTILRVHIPPGAVINLLNLVEVASPQGISLIVRLPFMSGSGACQSMVQSLTQSGAMVQPMPPSSFPMSPSSFPMLG